MTSTTTSSPGVVVEQTIFSFTARPGMATNLNLLPALALLLLILPTNLSAGTNSVTACGTVITTAGTWKLTNNLTCSGDAVEIQISSVNLKLNGFTITGPGADSGSAHGILIVSSAGTGLKSVTILGPGTVTAFPDGVIFNGTNGGGVVDVNLTSNGIGLVLNSDNLGAASTALLVSQNNLQKNDIGIDAGSLTSSTIAGNNCSGNHDGIDLLAGSGNKLLGNTCSNNTHAGITLGGSGSTGSAGNTLEGNRTSNNTFYGIFLGPAADDDHLIGNVALGNHFLDINDENSNCGSDTYVSDVFGTADESCVK